MKVIQLVQNDTAPNLNFTIKQDGLPVDLTGATVTFKMRLHTATTLKINRACIIDSAPAGTCHLVFTGTDLDTVGTYVAELEITFTGGAKQTSKELMRIDVRDDL